MGELSQSSVAELRDARPGDEKAIFALIRDLAVFERLEHQVTGSAESLGEHLFGQQPCVHGMVAIRNDQICGYALYFLNYSTFLTQPGLYLEDIYVAPESRGKGIGQALLKRLAARAVERGCGRFEWAVLDWNETAIRFYERLGATVMPDWRICRVADRALHSLAGVQNSKT